MSNRLKILNVALAIAIMPVGAAAAQEANAKLKSLPPAATGGRVTTVEVVKKGTSVSYEAVVVKAGGKSEIVVNADGTAAK